MLTVAARTFVAGGSCKAVAYISQRREGLAFRQAGTRKAALTHFRVWACCGSAKSARSSPFSTSWPYLATINW